jgi:hypothetical protein
LEKADLTPPVAPSSLYATPDKKQWTAQNRIQMSWQQSADPDGSGLAGYSYVWDTRAFTTPDTTVDTRLLQIFSPVLGDGNNHYFHIRAIDNAGNASNAKHFGPFYIDTTPPQKGSILINDGLDETDFSQVTLTLFAEDTLSGLKYMVFSNDNNTWGPAQTFQERISYDLSSGKGEKQVYVKFSDDSENWTQAVIKDSIVFGLPKPAKPQNLKAESLDATIIVSWDEINQATYAVLKSESQTGFFYPVNAFEINHSHVMNNRVYFTDTHVTNHSDDYYKVIATIDGIHSEPSEVIHATAQNKYSFDISVIDPVKMINIGSMARYYIQVHSGDDFKGTIHLTVSGLDSALARSFVMDGNNLGASISDLAPPALVILEITAGSAAPVQEHRFEITAQNVWTSGSSDFYHVPSSLIIRPRASSGIHAEVEKARIHKGEQIQIYGSIIPSLADKSVKIHLNNQVIETYTLQGGGFVDTTTIGTLPIGQYEFNASFIDNQSDMHESIKRQFTITKGISTLTCLRESAETPTDDSPFNIYGILFPHMPNENVIIRVIDPSQHHTDHVVRTDMNGHYTFTQDAFTQTGEWTFKAYWMGNDQYIGCESALITIPFGIDIGRVIILAGGEVQNNAYWDVTEKLTTDAYRAFKANGFSDEMIHYIINTDTIDINNDGKSDNVVDDYLPTINGFTHAIGFQFSNVLDHDTPLYVYMQGHATNEKAFKVLGDDQTITSQEIKNALDDIQEANNCTVVLLLESCYSGLFISDLQATNRVILTSADDQAYQTDASGQISFSKFLFSGLSRGDSLKLAFDRARMRMLNLGYPSPQISDPSEISRHIYLGGMLSWAQTSRIESIVLPEVIKDKSYCPITVKTDETIKNVWVKTIRPDMRLSDSQSLILYPEYDLNVNNQTGYFEGTLDHLNVPGVYKILTFVENYDHIVSDPIIQYLSVDVLTKIQGDINENGVIDFEDVIQVIKKVSD